MCMKMMISWIFLIILSCILYFLFFFIFLIKEIFCNFQSWITHILDCNRYVGAGINILMSISDGLDPFTFYRKMEKARPRREEIYRKICLLAARVGLLTLMLYFLWLLFPVCTLTWLVNNYVCRQEKVLIGETKVQKTQLSIRKS